MNKNAKIGIVLVLITMSCSSTPNKNKMTLENLEQSFTYEDDPELDHYISETIENPSNCFSLNKFNTHFDYEKISKTAEKLESNQKLEESETLYIQNDLFSQMMNLCPFTDAEINYRQKISKKGLINLKHTMREAYEKLKFNNMYYFYAMRAIIQSHNIKVYPIHKQKQLVAMIRKQIQYLEDKSPSFLEQMIAQNLTQRLQEQKLIPATKSKLDLLKKEVEEFKIYKEKIIIPRSNNIMSEVIFSFGDSKSECFLQNKQINCTKTIDEFHKQVKDMVKTARDEESEVARNYLLKLLQYYP